METRRRKVKEGEKKQLVISDVDGTLADNGVVPEDTLQLLEGMRRRGETRFTVATGRVAGSLLRLPWTAPLITEGGARIIDPNTNKTIEHHELDHNSMLWLLDQIAKGHVPYASYSADGRLPYIAFVRPGEETPARLQREASVVLGQEGFAARLLADRPCRVNFQWSETRETVPIGINVTRNERSIDLLPPGVNKRTGVESVCRHVGIPIAKTVVAGNDENDGPLVNIEEALAIVVGDTLPPEAVRRPHLRVATPHHLADALRPYVLAS